jgi:D-glycero-alpha-D-manno-heptose 1-phosphate guanylyltransferase|tara:strand:+ start:2048 stop:2752 length:705 start_codon:yes stop_codon:yes gene_type:complete
MSIENIKILILVGGFGTRLRDVISDVPKPMAPINKKPFLLHKIEKIREYLPKNQIYLLTHHMSDIIEEYFKEHSNIHFIKEEQALGTGGSIKHAIAMIDLLDEERVLVMNGDTYIEPDYIDFIENSTLEINMMTSVVEDCSRFNTLEIKNNMVIKFKKKDSTIRDASINIGCYIFNNLTFIKNMPEKYFSLENKFNEMIDSIDIKSYEYKGIFIDIGTPDDYKRLINEKSNERK